MSDFQLEFFSDPHVWLRVTAIGLSVALTHSVAERLFSALSPVQGKYHSWQLMRAHPTSLLHRLPSFLRFLQSDKAYLAIVWISLASAASLMILSPRSGMFSVMLFTAILGQIYFTHFNYAGLDGTHHMLALLSISLWVATLFPPGSLGFDACVWNIAIQTIFAYFLAGVAKLFGSVWLDGTAVMKIMGSTAYGRPAMYHFLKAHPYLSRATTYSVLVFELAFPLILIGSPSVVIAILLIALVFHVGNAAFMGLGQFLLTYPVGFPAIIYCWVLLWQPLVRANTMH